MGSEHKADLLVVNGDIVTMNAERQVLLGGAVAIAGGRILDVGAGWAGAVIHQKGLALRAALELLVE